LKIRKLQLVLLFMLSVLLVSTVAYAYVGPEFGSRILRYGMIGGDVQELQDFLNNNNYPVGYADGIFGAKTRNGVINFQKNNGLVADGIVGPKTFAAINKAGGNNSPKYTVKKGDTLYSKPIPDLKIVVDKSDHLLTMFAGKTPLKSYRVAFGEGGLGDKERAGDRKTPEGTFYVAERSVLSPPDQYLGSRWLRISYPNIEDAERGLNSGMIDEDTYRAIVRAINNREIPPQRTALGGGIGIHGGSNSGENQGDYWTWGCVGMTDPDIEEIFDYIPVGTEVVIKY